MHLPKEVSFILERLYLAGFEGYVVGGAVRDYLLGFRPHDFDVTTSATPEEISLLFHDVHLVTHGLKHGTVTLIINSEAYEVTTYRTEEGYSDHRRPDKVTFVTNLKEDLARRDFTINALAYYKKVIDFFGGVEDLNNKMIRAVGNPQERFTEDSLRILRALRFSAQLGFAIEPQTKKAILDLKHTLSFISMERIQSEMAKMLIGDLSLIFPEYFSVFVAILPELEVADAKKVAELLVQSPKSLPLRLYLLIGSLNDAIAIARRLKFNRIVVRKISVLSRYQNQLLEVNRITYRKLLSRLTYDEALLVLQHHHLLGRPVDFGLLELAKDDCTSIGQLKINGHDMLTLGVQAKSINSHLESILNLVMEGKLENKKETLIDYVTEIILK